MITILEQRRLKSLSASTTGTSFHRETNANFDSEKDLFGFLIERFRALTCISQPHCAPSRITPYPPHFYECLICYIKKYASPPNYVFARVRPNTKYTPAWSAAKLFCSGAWSAAKLFRKGAWSADKFFCSGDRVRRKENEEFRMTSDNVNAGKMIILKSKSRC